MKEDSLVKELLNYIKTDEEFFKEFANFLERDYGKREIILVILRKIILNSVKEIFKE